MVSSPQNEFEDVKEEDIDSRKGRSFDLLAGEVVVGLVIVVVVVVVVVGLVSSVREYVAGSMSTVIDCRYDSTNSSSNLGILKHPIS